MYILSIETATKVCSVALSCGKDVVFERTNENGPSHASQLGVFVEEALTYLKTLGGELQAVAVSAGPGSYTGLRIGVSEAKGLCYGLGIPLIAIDTLRIMATVARQVKRLPADAWLCPMIDARRMEVYTEIYDENTMVVKPTSADIVDADSYAHLLDKRHIVFFGDGAEKCRAVITHQNAHFEADVHPLASCMSELAYDAFLQQKFVDVAYYEPFYLKEFVATTPKNKVLGL